MIKFKIYNVYLILVDKDVEDTENDIIEMKALNYALLNYGEKMDKKDMELFENIIFKSDIIKGENLKMPIQGNFYLILFRHDFTINLK